MPRPLLPLRMPLPYFDGSSPESSNSATLANSMIDPPGDYARELIRDCGLSTQSVEVRSGIPPALEWARSGAMALTGESERPPRFASGPLATAAAGAGRALAALAPSTQLNQLDAAALLGERAAIAGLERIGRESPGGSARLLETLDGTIAINLPRSDDWSLLPAWLRSEIAPQSSDEQNAWDGLARLVAGQSLSDLVDQGRLLGLAVTAAPRVPVRNRNWFQLSHASETYPHNTEKPIRLLDLASLWAGPLATSLLSMAGIEVLKIESPERPDGARDGPRRFFDLMNANKRGCALDLHAARDRRLFEQLLESADIVFESARPRALEQLGYDAGSWVSARAGRIWVSITGYGRQAPNRDWIAYGDDAAIAAGLAWSTRATSNPKTGTANDSSSPCFCADAIADPIAGLHAAVATLAHLQNGRGGVLDLSLVDIAGWAATFSAGELDAPIERAADGDYVTVGHHREKIERPRARNVLGTAPRLAMPKANLIADWTGSC